MVDISSDEYKVDWCSLEEDECNEFSCRRCHVAKEHHTELKIEEHDDDIRAFTSFEKEGNINNIPVMVNHTNVIAKLNISALEKLQSLGVLPKTKVMYSPMYLKQYISQFVKLRKYNRLPIPDVIYVEKDIPAVFIWEGFGVYCIAPRIEDGGM